MSLSNLKAPKGANRPKTRVGRGQASGLGKTAGRGGKGQKARTGNMHFEGFEGGQMPLHRRIPKRGFTNIFRNEFRTVNVDRLNVFESGSVVTPDAFEDAGLLKKGTAPIKVLGNGEVKVVLTVKAHKFSAAAEKKIREAGGTTEVLASRTGKA